MNKGVNMRIAYVSAVMAVGFICLHSQLGAQTILTTWGQSDNGNASCRVPVCIVAHGNIHGEWLDTLSIYLDKHAETPALLLVSNASQHNRVIVMNVDKSLSVAISKLLHTSLRNPGTIWNDMRMLAIEYLSPCSIWEMDSGASLTSDDPIHEQVNARLSPVRLPSPLTESNHFGVRPSGVQDHDFMPIVNAYTLFSPLLYYPPRGYPAQFVREDRNGHAPYAPELVRIDLRNDQEKQVVIVQSAIDGLPDVHDDFYQNTVGPQQSILHKPLLDAVIVPAGVMHPYNRLATLHRYDALWAMYLPATFASHSDVVRGYIAQAILPMLDRSIAIVSPMVVRQVSSTDGPEAKGWRVSISLQKQMAHWTRMTQDDCYKDPRLDDCKDAGTLLISAYRHLSRTGAVSKSEPNGARRWVNKLRLARYAFPVPATSHHQVIMSPARPNTLDVHAAVHVNSGKRWEGVVPLWHAIHGHEYQQVTYHVQKTPDAVNPALVAGVYPHMTYYNAELVGEVTGYLAFQTTIQAWNVHNMSVDSILWTHDDAFVGREWMTAWSRNRTVCSAMAGAARLPANISDWSKHAWSWVKSPRAQLSARQFIDNVAVRDLIKESSHASQCLNKGMSFGQSDLILIRPGCNGGNASSFWGILQAASDASLFLEIAWPTTLTCAFSADKISQYRLYTRWDGDRNNASATYAEHLRGQYDVFHPMKLSYSAMTMTRLTMRDEGWTQTF